MSPRSAKRNQQDAPLTGRKAVIVVERAGAMIRVDGVPADQAGCVLADILATFRSLAQRYPELVPELSMVPGGEPIAVVDDEWADESKRDRRVGF